MDKINKQADTDEGTLRISFDAKNKVAIGDFSRGGKNWGKLEALDHDFAKKHILPFGLFLPELQETTFYFTESRGTADFIVDVLTDFWKSNKERFSHVHTLVLNADNGPECHSRRTQFIKRICEFSKDFNIKVQLAYYPPYHSKYNPIERVWGGLEQHWNGDILDSKETVLKFAQSFIWAKKQAVVKFIDKVYETGVKIPAKQMGLYEIAINRLNETIGKWFISIEPDRVNEIIYSA